MHSISGCISAQCTFKHEFCGIAFPPIGTPDYSLTEPLNGRDRTYPCGGKPKGASQASWRQGSSYEVTIEGTAFHNGGHCQFAFSKGTGTKATDTFLVVRTILDKCIPSIGPHKYTVTVPPNYPLGPAVFAWSWVNAIGNREYYMNIASTLRSRGPLKANYLQGLVS